MKERLNHPLYEKSRVFDTYTEAGNAEALRLSAEIVANSDWIPTPPNIDKVKL